MTPSTSPYIRKQYVPLCIVCPIDTPVEGRDWKLEGEGKHTPYANDVRGKHEAREAGSQGARSQQHEASDAAKHEDKDDEALADDADVEPV